jgi:hypothetical protein
LSLSKILVSILFLFLVVFLGGCFLFICSDTTDLGSDHTGYVLKHIYDHYNSNITIAIITGMHPRETLAVGPEMLTAQTFAFFNKVKVINYEVVVEENKDKYKESRNNGEALVVNYIMPDIYKSDIDLIIISHSHIPSYGKGFYVATPAMDSASVHLGESIANAGINFRYYPNKGNAKYKSSSAALISKPLANDGYPLLVYEIPENITALDSFSKTYDLMSVSTDILKEMN